jgi:dienelactone hydrolase
MLILAGDDDHMWPSAAMAKELAERRRSHGREADTELAIYPGAGHTFLNYQRQALPAASRSRWDFGGTPSADEEACSDAWARIGDFLRS